MYYSKRLIYSISIEYEVGLLNLYVNYLFQDFVESKKSVILEIFKNFKSTALLVNLNILTFLREDKTGN